MKNVLVIVCTFLLCATMTAGELTAAILASNQKFNTDATFSPKTPDFGCSIILRDELNTNIETLLAFEADPLNGNTLFARILFASSYMEISAGPSFGVFNTGSNKTGVVNLFQPGLGIGFSIIAPGMLVAHVDTDFALPAPANTNGTIYLQKSTISAGFYLPNVICSIELNQKTNTEAGKRIVSITDYGFYTEAFRKGSKFRVSVDFIYRISDFFIAPENEGNRKLGNLVLGGGLTWAPSMDFNFFILGTSSLYTFSLGTPVSGLNNPLFEVKSGITMNIGKSKTKPEILNDI
ncbi:MAG TPA: hypothetical protein VJ861_06605 [Treponemataceae bacterium]|nr:hypothetical protein [Treponemataceae bacterium]